MVNHHTTDAGLLTMARTLPYSQLPEYIIGMIALITDAREFGFTETYALYLKCRDIAIMRVLAVC
jgi:hypothetical protein